ncbi:MAG: hypothetical protein IKG79_03630 [Neisseriaceae bacterium]|nr:hypothetical protein [Neisseriaceae bacterium]
MFSQWGISADRRTGFNYRNKTAAAISQRVLYLPLSTRPKLVFRLPEKFWAKEKTLSGVFSAYCLVVLELYGENHGVSRFWVDFVVYIGYNVYRLKFI